MNERLEQLKKQAVNYAEEVFDYHGKDYREIVMEKFAKLIVRECMQQCEQVRDDAASQKKSEFLTESGKMLYEGVYGGANNCGYAIQQHFGVEE